ncbi:uncharacterized protein V1510DRAFT_408367 [Dipodascopsis tothii]|uniref:uncharacterized protein n=1 Tax=Dipodascopsis tothii TaxID=44089 RepID=UPI0034CE7FF8
MTKEGQKYWNNRETKESVWEMPLEYKLALETTADSPDGGESPEEKAERSFSKLLKDSGVTYGWDWERTLRKIVLHPQFHVISDAKDRRVAFQKYFEQSRQQEIESALKKYNGLKEAYMKLLHDKAVKPYSRWKTFLPLLKDELAFQNFEEETGEARRLFEDYTFQLRRDQRERENKDREEAMIFLTTYLKSMNLTVLSHWQDVLDRLRHDPSIKEHPKVRTLNKLDLLIVYEGFMKQLETEYNDKRAERSQKRRRVRSPA